MSRHPAKATSAPEMNWATLIKRVSLMVTEQTGVQLGEKQFGMVEGRIRRRLVELGIDPEEYPAYLEANLRVETQALISLLTTHHTYFFREFAQFEYLEREGLRAIVEEKRKSGDKTIRVWSAACSYGHEVYSLAMFLSTHLPGIAPDFTFEILGTDVDPESVRLARNGVYHQRDVKSIPLQYMSGNWAKGSGEIAEFYKVRKALRDHCKFEPHNLLSETWPEPARKFDLIFCRNVFIYFTIEQVRKIATGLVSRLAPSGILCVGVSESLHSLNLPASPVGPSIYVSGTERRAVQVEKRRLEIVRAPAPAPVVKRKLRVLCVDDSPSILKLLSLALTGEQGFEVVGTASNGAEAVRKRAELKPDVMTLDIHMPEMDGVEYLRTQMGSGHPPVVMVSAVPRDDAQLALKCLEFGASDYVEKPSLSNFDEQAEEIRLKLQCAYRQFAQDHRSGPADQPFAGVKRCSSDPEGALRVVSCQLGERKRLSEVLRSLPRPQCPTIVVIDGSGAVLQQYAAELKKTIGLEAVYAGAGSSGLPAALKRDTVYLLDSIDELARRRLEYSRKRASVLVFGKVKARLSRELLAWKAQGAQLLAEDLGAEESHCGLRKLATDVVPVTSFAYLSCDFLNGGEGK